MLRKGQSRLRRGQSLQAVARKTRRTSNPFCEVTPAGARQRSRINVKGPRKPHGNEAASLLAQASHLRWPVFASQRPVSPSARPVPTSSGKDQERVRTTLLLKQSFARKETKPSKQIRPPVILHMAKEETTILMEKPRQSSLLFVANTED